MKYPLAILISIFTTLLFGLISYMLKESVRVIDMVILYFVILAWIGKTEN